MQKITELSDADLSTLVGGTDELRRQVGAGGYEAMPMIHAGVLVPAIES